MRLSSRIWIKVMLGVTFLAPTTSIEAIDRLIVLTGENRIAYYRIDANGSASLVGSYGTKELPGVFPAQSLDVGSGNIVTTYDSQRRKVGQFTFDGQTEKLVSYHGDSGSQTGPGGHILEQPDLGESFRGEGSVYDKSRGTLQEMELASLWRQTGDRYLALFVMGGYIGGLKTHAIERLTREAHSTKPAEARAWLTSNSQFKAAAVSPWQELFVSDGTRPVVRRFRLKDGELVANGEISDKEWGGVGALRFSADGELFIATREVTGRQEILRYSFVLDDFVNWRPVLRDRIQLEGPDLLDFALARPVGYVLSEKTHPLKKLSAQEAGGHFGISQTVFVSPQTNSETSVIALVEYAPGGHTPVHSHPQMEQVEIVISGRALWEVGETEREVGAGDVIFCPRNVKHGYKVLGDQPFKFLQVEWREWKISR